MKEKVYRINEDLVVLIYKSTRDLTQQEYEKYNCKYLKNRYIF